MKSNLKTVEKGLQKLSMGYMVSKDGNTLYVMDSEYNAICKIYKHDVDRRVQVKYPCGGAWLTYLNQKQVVEDLKNIVNK